MFDHGADMTRFSRALGGCTILAFLGAWFAIGHAAAEQEIGSVVGLAPDVFGTATGAEPVRLLDGTGVVSNELIHTMADAAAHIVFLDDSNLRIGANSMVVLDRLVYDPDQGVKELFLGLAVGIARFASGDVDPDGFLLETPAAFVGIRGTDFVVFVDQSGRTIIAVLDGIVIVIPKGRDPVLVRAGETLVVELDQDRPVILRAGIDVPGDPGLGVFPGAGQQQEAGTSTGDGTVDIGDRSIQPTIPTGSPPVHRQPTVHHPSVPSNY